MKYKSREVYDGFYNSHTHLRTILHWIESFCRNRFGKEPLMTGSQRTHATSVSIYAGKVINKKTGELYLESEVPVSVHETSPLRGADLRASILTAGENQILVSAINKEFSYDPARPRIKCAMLHAVGSGAIHFHIQVSDKTIKKDGGV